MNQSINKMKTVAILLVIALAVSAENSTDTNPSTEDVEAFWNLDWNHFKKLFGIDTNSTEADDEIVPTTESELDVRFDFGQFESSSEAQNETSSTKECVFCWEFIFGTLFSEQQPSRPQNDTEDEDHENTIVGADPEIEYDWISSTSSEEDRNGFQNHNPMLSSEDVSNETIIEP